MPAAGSTQRGRSPVLVLRDTGAAAVCQCQCRDGFAPHVVPGALWGKRLGRKDGSAPPMAVPGHRGFYLAWRQPNPLQPQCPWGKKTTQGFGCLGGTGGRPWRCRFGPDHRSPPRLRSTAIPREVIPSLHFYFWPAFICKAPRAGAGSSHRECRGATPAAEIAPAQHPLPTGRVRCAQCHPGEMGSGPRRHPTVLPGCWDRTQRAPKTMLFGVNLPMPRDGDTGSHGDKPLQALTQWSKIGFYFF